MMDRKSNTSSPAPTVQLRSAGGQLGNAFMGTLIYPSLFYRMFLHLVFHKVRHILVQ